MTTAKIGPQLNPGDKVILGKHENHPVIGDSWLPEMDKYVGKETIIVKEEVYNTFRYYMVDIDRGRWVWRSENMTIISSTPIVSAIEYGVNCKKCYEFCEHARKIQNFTCYRCSH